VRHRVAGPSDHPDAALNVLDALASFCARTREGLTGAPQARREHPDAARDVVVALSRERLTQAPQVVARHPRIVPRKTGSH
jgi:hypothetical protein